MFTVLNEKKKRSPEEVESEFPNRKYILINFGDIQNPMGNLYCVSTSDDSNGCSGERLF